VLPSHAPPEPRPSDPTPPPMKSRPRQEPPT
jgi:hypothetical protein